jgi:N-acetylmuramoyl-L-alanine amidase
MNWLVATRAGELLRKANVRVVFTKRARDEFATNKQRAEIANRAHADLLLRLHCDTGAGSGITFYYPSRAGHQDGVRGPSTRVRIESQRAAKIVHDVTVAKLTGALRDNGIHGDDSTQIGRRQGALTGSIYSQVPVVLIEMVFLSNQRDARFIGSTPGREKMAQSIAAGVLTYLGTTHRTNAAPSSQ